MVRYLLVLLFMLPIVGNAQYAVSTSFADGDVLVKSDKDFRTDGMLRATATFALGKPFSYNILMPYIKGELEYQFEERWSVRGEVYYQAGEMGSSARMFTHYHSAFTGVSYHFMKNNHFDPYAGLQVGALWSEMTNEVAAMVILDHELQRSSVDAVISPIIGVNYYANNYFHVFANVRYLYGNRAAAYARQNLSELRISFGLGFNINVKRKR